MTQHIVFVLLHKLYQKQVMIFLNLTILLKQQVDLLESQHQYFLNYVSEHP